MWGAALMRWREFFGRAGDLLGAARLRWGRLRRAERALRPELLAMQQERLRILLAHAARSSPFYAGRWGGRVPRPEDLASLEPVTKQELLDRRFDDALTDRSLSRESLRPYLGAAGRHPHVVLATSGTTGEPVMVPYTRREWLEGMALVLRGQARHSPRLADLVRRGRRVAAVMTQNPIHASSQLSGSLGCFPGMNLALAAGSPLEEQLARLDTFQPRIVTGYPSAVDALAAAQLEGRLRIRPEVVQTGGETLSAALRARVRAAWGVDLFDCYGLTETLVIAWECREHRGLHIDEDAVVMEVVDEADRVLHHGVLGDSVLVTNLFNHTLPIIRYRVTDRMAISDEPCPCGLPFARITAIEGRKDEVLSLPGDSGGSVNVHATAIETVLEEMSGVRRFQIQGSSGGVRLRVVPREGAEGVLDKLEAAVSAFLTSHGAARGAIRIEVVPSIEDERGATDKRTKVIRDAPPGVRDDHSSRGSS